MPKRGRGFIALSNRSKQRLLAGTNMRLNSAAHPINEQPSIDAVIEQMPKPAASLMLSWRTSEQQLHSLVRYSVGDYRATCTSLGSSSATREL